jgi:hypothetical protein
MNFRAFRIGNFLHGVKRSFATTGKWLAASAEGFAWIILRTPLGWAASIKKSSKIEGAKDYFCLISQLALTQWPELRGVCAGVLTQ